jgi:ParB-like chromosome segregation protein Spo0J
MPKQTNSARATRAAPPKIEWPADQVERRSIAELVPYARNARLHSDAQIAQIAASIREWGWTIPVLVDETGALIAGHGRVLAARLLEIDAVPTMTARGWTEAKIRAYRLADNKLAELSSWDAELLGLELSDLRDLGATVELTGFDAKSIEELIAGPRAPGSFDSYDETIETEHQCPKCGFSWSGSAGISHKVAEEQDSETL